MAKYAVCEIFAKKLLTPVKLYLACRLVKSYGLTQLEVSKMLGIKQPLINYVLTGKRKPKCLGLIERSPKLREYLDNLAESIASKRVEVAAEHFCELCETVRSDEELFKEVVEFLGYSIEDVYVPSTRRKR